MKVKNKIFTIIILITLFIITLNSNIYATEIEKEQYSKKYQEWMELDEEQKKNTIAPLPINVRNTNNTNKKSSVFNILKAVTIPKSFDLRDHITVEVKNQQNTELCWGFSANTSLETYLALNNKIYNFSERHLEYNTAKNYLNGTNKDALNRTLGAGGYASTAFTYYSRGSGPILEKDMPFENNEDPIRIEQLPTKDPVQKVDDMIYFPNIYKRKDTNGKLIYEDGSGVKYTTQEILQIRNQIKEHIMKYGGISTSINGNGTYLNTSTWADNLIDSTLYANHAVTIIGWDDNYSKYNFLSNCRPTTDGAYIVLNSWGSNWGKNGVYYISYEDCLIESQLRGVTSVSDINYDSLYQHDTSEMYAQFNAKYSANVFTSQQNEKLTEIMIGTWSNQTCNIYINKSGNDLNINNLTKIASNVTLVPGYNTIKINENINFLKGNKFSIVVEATKGIGIEDNCGYFAKATSNAGESYASNDGTYWTDMYSLYNNYGNMNFCIKAYTQTISQNIEIPSKVTGLKTTSQGYNDVTLAWAAQNNVSWYEIYKLNTTTNQYDKIANSSNNWYKVSNLQEGTTYKFKVRAYKNNMYGDYSSIITISTKQRINLAYCTITGISDKTYTGKNITQNIRITYKNNTLSNSNYTITYSNNKNPGKATITIVGKQGLTGNIKKTFIIKPKKVTGFKVKSQKTNEIKLSWSKHPGVTGYKLYSYNYKKDKWEYKGKIKGTSCTIKKLKAGNTYKYKVRAYKTIDNTQYFGAYSSSIKTATKTKTPNISKLTTKNKKATIKWKKISEASGYEIYMATSKKGKYSKVKTVSKSKTTSYTKNKLKKNKKYYFKIRTYKTVDGKKIYSSYSSVKSIKIK